MMYAPTWPDSVVGDVKLPGDPLVLVTPWYEPLPEMENTLSPPGARHQPIWMDVPEAM